MSLKSSFWWMANVDRSIIRNCPETDQNRYYSLGVIIFIAAIIAAASFSHAIFLLADPITEDLSIELPFTERFEKINLIAAASFVIAFPLWFFFILHLNKAFMPLITPGDGMKELFKKAWLRILTSVLIAFLVTCPLILLFFSKDISENYEAQISEATAEKNVVIARASNTDDEKQIRLDKEKQEQLEENKHSENDNTSVTAEKDDVTGQSSSSYPNSSIPETNSTYEILNWQRKLKARELKNAPDMYESKKKRLKEIDYEIKIKEAKVKIESCRYGCQSYGVVYECKKEMVPLLGEDSENSEDPIYLKYSKRLRELTSLFANMTCDVEYAKEGRIAERIDKDIEILQEDISRLNLDKNRSKEWILAYDNGTFTEKIENEINNLTKKIETIISSRKKAKEEQVARVEKEAAHISLRQRIIQLGKILTNSGWGVIIMFGLIFLFFFSVEISPKIMKLFFPKQNYERELDGHSFEHAKTMEYIKKQINSVIEKRASLDNALINKAANPEDLLKSPYAQIIESMIRDHLIGTRSQLAYPESSNHPEPEPLDNFIQKWGILVLSIMVATVLWFIGTQKEHMEFLSLSGMAIFATISTACYAVFDKIYTALDKALGDKK
uniref:DUF4407 domain-containing protein n=1 Tax=Candidatus Kentrum sp. LFY TaxID=2126342 RepID=A0A450WS63_9GAMM|nr:MAG: protein of unknown function (DUF4407) [Candidatus Kentron sp. LFY]